MSVWFATLGAALLLAAPPQGSVEIGGPHLRQLVDRPHDTPPRPWAQARALELKVVPGGVELRARWRVLATTPGWWSGRLLGPSARIRSTQLRDKSGIRDANVWAGPDGYSVAERITGPVELTVEAFLPGSADKGAFALDVMAATSGTIELTVEGDDKLRPFARDGTPVAFTDGRFHTGAASLELRPPPPKGASTGTIAIAHVGLGLTVGEAEAHGKAHVRWDVRRGELKRVELEVKALGTDLQVEGPNVADWRAQDGRVVIDLHKSVEDRLDVELSWTIAVPNKEEARIPMPVVDALGVFRSESTFQFARDGDIDFRPDLTGWTAIPANALPTWGSGLVIGTPKSAFQRTSGGSGGKATLDLYRFVPVEAPPTVVEVADYAIALSEEGRELMRARYDVRNERGSHLKLQLPKGSRLLSVEVAGVEVTPAREGKRWLVPLKRSVVSVDGLITVPVVVALMREDKVWARRERRALELPTVDAPVQVSRATVFLPREFINKLEPGDGPVVDDFTRGEGVNYGWSDENTLSRQADAVFQDAVDAWQDNDFDRARDRLDQIESMGASNENTRKLESNVAIVRPKPVARAPDADPADPEPALNAAPPADMDSGVSFKRSAGKRRVRALLRARSGKLKRRQREHRKKAKNLRKSGDYKAAQQEYEAAIDATEELDQLEDDGDASAYDFESDEIHGELEQLKEEEAYREVLEQGQSQESEAPAKEPSGEQTSDVKELWSDDIDYVVPVDPEPEEPQVLISRPAVRVLIPTIGAPTRYQHLLLEPNARRRIPIDARRKKEKRREDR